LKKLRWVVIQHVDLLETQFATQHEIQIVSHPCTLLSRDPSFVVAFEARALDPPKVGSVVDPEVVHLTSEVLTNESLPLRYVWPELVLVSWLAILSEVMELDDF
jgi:hypothetical protein